MNAAKDEPRNRKSKNLSVETCIKTRFQFVIRVVIEVHPPRTHEYE